MKIQFRAVKLSKENRKKLDYINEIIEEYQNDGYVLTLRQLYYQLVSRDIIPNNVSEYGKLSTILKEGRMAGIVDWDAIEDRLRQPYTPSAFDSPKNILDACIQQYMLHRQEGQDTYLEVWVEKDALSGVLKRVTSKYHVPILVNRGYSSASAMYDSYERFFKAIKNGQKVKILYLGDHDPSGEDMIRDIYDRSLEFLKGSEEVRNYMYFNDDNQDCYHRLSKYMDEKGLDEEFSLECVKDDLVSNIQFEVTPIALTKAQIRQYNPPPNPAKITDPRAKAYIERHGAVSWEVDALKPEVLHKLLEDNILANIDLEKYEEILDKEKEGITKLKALKPYL